MNKFFNLVGFKNIKDKVDSTMFLIGFLLLSIGFYLFPMPFFYFFILFGVGLMALANSGAVNE